MAEPPARKRCLLWDYTNTRDRPAAIEQLFAPADTASPDASAAAAPAASPFKSVHNWNAWCPPELRGRLPFRPMIRTRAQLEMEEWSWICDSDAEVVHYLNEPERQQQGSGPVPPREAAAWWLGTVVPELRGRRGKKLVGPACASDEAGGAWLAEFMGIVCGGEGEDDGEGAKGAPDYLGVHYYGDDVEHAKRYLTGMWERYRLPLNVCEMACVSRDAAEVERFTEEMSGWMDGRAWVDEYGWFGCMTRCADDFVSPAAQLMDEEGRFTPLMRRLMGRESCGKGDC